MSGQLKVISLYSGAGGLDIGFKQAGYKTVLCVESWERATETLSLNNITENILNIDIRDVNFIKQGKELGPIDVVIGGPPCPPYSQTRHYLTNKKSGFDDEVSGFAVKEYFRVIKDIKPKAFLFENVDGFAYKTHKEPLEYVLKESERLGYNVVYKVINAADFGVPQTRKRFILIGVQKDIGTFEFPLETHSNDNKLGTLPWVTCKECISEFDNITEEEKEQRPGAKYYYLLKDIPPGDNYLFYTEKRGSKNPIFKWKSRYWTFLLKLSPDRPSWTIQASFSNNQGPFHWQNRFLRIEEIKRLQTFPDEYILAGDFKEQWRQIGNAVPPQLAYILAERLREYLT